MGFFSCCSAILQKDSPNEVDYTAVEDMDWFELTLGNTPRAKNFVSELYERLVSPASDETVEKIVKSMGNASHEKALRALASPFMKMVDTVQQDIENKDNLLKNGINIEVQALKQRNELVHSELVANPKLRTMREVVENFKPNWKRLLLKSRYYITSCNLKNLMERKYPLNVANPETRAKNLEKILSYFNRMTDFVVYLHKSCSHSKALRSSWYKQQLDEINKAAAHYRGLYVIYHFKSNRKHDELPSGTVPRTIGYMQKCPGGVRFLYDSAPFLHKLGLLYTCGTNMYWPAHFRLKLLINVSRDMIKEFEADDEMLRGILALNIWIYMMLYLHSLSQNDCGNSTEISGVLQKFRSTLATYGLVLRHCPQVFFNSTFPEFRHIEFNQEKTSFRDYFGPGQMIVRHVEKICRDIMNNNNNNNDETKQDAEVPMSDQSTNDGGSASDNNDDDVACG